MKTLILNSDLVITKNRKNQICFLISSAISNKKLKKLKNKFALEIENFKNPLT